MIQKMKDQNISQLVKNQKWGERTQEKVINKRKKTLQNWRLKQKEHNCKEVQQVMVYEK